MNHLSVFCLIQSFKVLIQPSYNLLNVLTFCNKIQNNVQNTYFWSENSILTDHLPPEPWRITYQTLAVRVHMHASANTNGQLISRLTKSGLS